MPVVEVKNLAGETVGSIELADEVFGADVKEHLFWEVVRAQRAGRRRGAASTKGRSELRGGGRKPYRQKGTGRARQGTRRAPNHVGGGTVFGPKPRSYRMRVPKRTRRSALRSAVSLRCRENRLIVLESLELEEIRTKGVVEALDRLEAPRALIVESRDNRRLELSVRNLPRCRMLSPAGVNVYDILDHEQLIVTTDTAKALEQRLARRRG
ncbi:50S ribosomal protein L4 [Myxococcota bacterium]